MHHQLRHCWRLHLSSGSRQATCTQRVFLPSTRPFCSLIFGGNTHLRPARGEGVATGMCKHLLQFSVGLGSKCSSKTESNAAAAAAGDDDRDAAAAAALGALLLTLRAESVGDFTAVCRVSATSASASARPLDIFPTATFRLIFHAYRTRASPSRRSTLTGRRAA